MCLHAPLFLCPCVFTVQKTDLLQDSLLLGNRDGLDECVVTEELVTEQIITYEAKAMVGEDSTKLLVHQLSNDWHFSISSDSSLGEQIVVSALDVRKSVEELILPCEAPNPS